MPGWDRSDDERLPRREFVVCLISLAFRPHSTYQSDDLINQQCG
jgi:hypothetical protein